MLLVCSTSEKEAESPSQEEEEGEQTDKVYGVLKEPRAQLYAFFCLLCQIILAEEWSEAGLADNTIGLSFA